MCGTIKPTYKLMTWWLNSWRLPKQNVKNENYTDSVTMCIHSTDRKTVHLSSTNEGVKRAESTRSLSARRYTCDIFFKLHLSNWTKNISPTIADNYTLSTYKLMAKISSQLIILRSYAKGAGYLCAYRRIFRLWDPFAI